MGLLILFYAEIEQIIIAHLDSIDVNLGLSHSSFYLIYFQCGLLAAKRNLMFIAHNG